MPNIPAFAEELVKSLRDGLEMEGPVSGETGKAENALPLVAISFVL